MERRQQRHIRSSYFDRKVRQLSREISEIDALLYNVPNGDVMQQCSMLERKRDDVVRALVLQIHTSVEDLLDLWLKSYLLGVPPDMRNAQARRKRTAGRAIEDILKGSRSIGFENKLRLLLGCGLIRKSIYKRLTTLNQLRNKCSHNWILRTYNIRRGIKPHLPKRPLLQFKNRDLYTVEVLGQFMEEYSRIYLQLFDRIYSN